MLTQWAVYVILPIFHLALNEPLKALPMKHMCCVTLKLYHVVVPLKIEQTNTTFFIGIDLSIFLKHLPPLYLLQLLQPRQLIGLKAPPVRMNDLEATVVKEYKHRKYLRLVNLFQKP